LENLFDEIVKCLLPNALFVTNDVIGRNGHMRWPEALEIINSMWRFLPDRYKYNHLMKRFESTYENWDCSQQGFEGIRAQDILGVMIEALNFVRFLGFGNLTDIFTDRCFGPNFDVKLHADKAFIDFLHELNVILIDHGYLKPTVMFAVVSNEKLENPVKCWRHWTPEFSLRRP
jgi:hypothetical protein